MYGVARIFRLAWTLIQVLVVLDVVARALTFVSLVGIFPRTTPSPKHVASTPTRSLPASLDRLSPTLSHDWLVLMGMQVAPLHDLMLESTASLSVVATLLQLDKETVSFPASLNHSSDSHIRATTVNVVHHSEEVGRELLSLHMEIMDAVDWVMLIHHYNRNRVLSPLYPIRAAAIATKDLVERTLLRKGNRSESEHPSLSVIWSRTLVSNIRSIVLRADTLWSLSNESINELQQLLRVLVREQHTLHNLSYIQSLNPPAVELPSFAGQSADTSDRLRVIWNAQNMIRLLHHMEGANIRARFLAENIVKAGQLLQQTMAASVDQCTHEAFKWNVAPLSNLVAPFVAASADLGKLESMREYAYNKTTALRAAIF